jgi:hypothetical protein
MKNQKKQELEDHTNNNIRLEKKLKIPQIKEGEARPPMPPLDKPMDQLLRPSHREGKHALNIVPSQDILSIRG